MEHACSGLWPSSCPGASADNCGLSSAACDVCGSAPTALAANWNADHMADAFLRESGDLLVSQPSLGSPDFTAALNGIELPSPPPLRLGPSAGPRTAANQLPMSPAMRHAQQAPAWQQLSAAGDVWRQLQQQQQQLQQQPGAPGLQSPAWDSSSMAAPLTPLVLGPKTPQLRALQPPNGVSALRQSPQQPALVAAPPLAASAGQPKPRPAKARPSSRAAKPQQQQQVSRPLPGLAFVAPGAPASLLPAVVVAPMPPAAAAAPASSTRPSPAPTAAAAKQAPPAPGSAVLPQPLQQQQQQPQQQQSGPWPPGSLVWAKVARFPYWPAVVVQPGSALAAGAPPAPAGSSGGPLSVLCRFLGTLDAAWLDPAKAVSAWGVHHSERIGRTKAASFVKAVKEAAAYAATGELPAGFAAGGGSGSSISLDETDTSSEAGSEQTASSRSWLDAGESRCLGAAGEAASRRMPAGAKRAGLPGLRRQRDKRPRRMFAE